MERIHVMATIQDIADRLGISKGTVSKALNGASDISETLQKSVLETAVEMGYTKLKRPGGERKLCILIRNMEYASPSHFGYDIVLGFRQMAEPAGYTVEVIPLTVALQTEFSYDAFMLQGNYLGAFVLGFSLRDPWMKDFRTSHTPAVLYDNYIRANPTIAYVGIDNSEGMELAVHLLCRLGHKNIGYLSHSLSSHVMQVRRRSFFYALSQAGLKSSRSFSKSEDDITEKMDEYLPDLLDQKVTALICSHDLIAGAAMKWCRENGISVPGRLSIIGFDDLPSSASSDPPLTTVRQDRLQLGKSGYYALESLMNSIPIGTLLLHAELIERSSTGTAPSV